MPESLKRLEYECSLKEELDPAWTLQQLTCPQLAPLRDIVAQNPHQFRVFGPDETTSNKLDAVYEATKKTWLEAYLREDMDGGELGPDGHVMEMLSEHTLEGCLEGYLLSGRHGFFATYESFVHVVDSMVNQHAKWLEKSKELSWRAPISSLNLLITSRITTGLPTRIRGSSTLLRIRARKLPVFICRRMLTLCCRPRGN